MPAPTPLEDFEFDLRGFLVLRSALDPHKVLQINEAYNRFPTLSNGEWIGNAQWRDYTKDIGFELHNLLDCDDRAFEFLIDHPSWINHLRHYAGEEALTDIGPGDGATMVIPGSHKSNLAHSYAGTTPGAIVWMRCREQSMPMP